MLVGNYSNKDIIQLWDFNSGKLIETIDIKEPLSGAYCLCAGYAHKSKYELYAAGFNCINKIKIFEGRQDVA